MGADRFRSEAWADTVEQASTAAEQDRDDVQLDLIDEPGGQVLIDHIGTTADDHGPCHTGCRRSSGANGSSPSHNATPWPRSRARAGAGAQHALRALARRQCGTEVTFAADGDGADEAETARALAALAARISAAGPETVAAHRARSSATARTGCVPAGPSACVAGPADPELAPALVGLGVTTGQNAAARDAGRRPVVPRGRLDRRLGQKVTSGSPKKSEMKLMKKKPKNTTLTSSSTVCHHFGRAFLGSLLFR
jgi:hypothetical protein